MNQTQKPFIRLNHEQWQQIINQQIESGLNQKNSVKPTTSVLRPFQTGNVN